MLRFRPYGLRRGIIPKLIFYPEARNRQRPPQIIRLESIRRFAATTSNTRNAIHRDDRKDAKSRHRPRHRHDLFESMTNTINNLNDQNLPSLKAAFLFWISKAARQQAARRKLPERLPLENARKILLHADTPHARKQIVNNDQGSRHAGWTRLIHLYLRPLQGTRAAMRAKGRTDEEGSIAQHLWALSRASEIANMMNSSPGEFSHDLESSRAMLNLWSKRCRFFTAHSETISTLNPRDTSLALGGARNARDCVDAIHNFIEAIKENPDDFEPDVSIYSYQLGALAICHLPGAAEEALQILKDLQNENPALLERNEALPLYSAVLLAFANSVQQSRGLALLRKAEEWWESLEEDGCDFARDPIAHSIWMKMRSTLGQTFETEKVLDFMLTRDIQPSVIHYNIALNAWANAATSDPTAQHRAEALLHKMTDSDRNIKPDRISYTAVLKACINSGTNGSFERANTILNLMERDESIKMDATVYREFYNGLVARLQRVYEPHEKEMIAMEIQQVLFRMGNLATTSDLNTCLLAWSRSFAVDLTKRMQVLYDEFCTGTVPKCPPDGHTYRVLLMGLANNQPTPKSVQYGEELLDRMKRQGIPQHVGVINQFVRLLARGSDSLQPAVDFVRGLERDFDSGASTVTPQENTYRYILEEYWKRPGMVMEADRWFKHMKHLAETTRPELSPRENSYAAMIHAWANSGEDEALDRAKKLFDEVKNTTHPSSYTYAAYQIAWSRSGRPDAAQRVEDILTDMQKEYSEHRDPKSRPGAPNFSIAINCWAKMGAAERAEAMLTRMEELYRSSGHAHIKPTADCYKAAIMAWAMSGEPEGGTRAIQLLDRMERAHAKNHTAPPPKRACYHFAMVAVGRSNDDSKARQCFDLLQRMKEYPHTRPIDATYVIVLRSCTATGGSFVEKEAAFQIAMKVWEDYRRLIRNPREDVLDRFLMAVYRLHPANEKRDELLEQVFEDCPEDMLRSKRIQDGLFKAASKDAADRILARIEQGSVQHLFGHPLTEEHSES